MKTFKVEYTCNGEHFSFDVEAVDLSNAQPAFWASVDLSNAITNSGLNRDCFKIVRVWELRFGDDE
jgi:hypothetical protein